ncbi:hypothetical protein [Changpingibacter yushuensis]|uniref:hypothetical protein n=1 Tax=Changpingibacter yushuensis TaxID=2758440 RepID=UPI00165DA2B9|nr:hypothetical protein [Changpingibacter yushuensis]
MPPRAAAVFGDDVVVTHTCHRILGYHEPNAVTLVGAAAARVPLSSIPRSQCVQ